MKKHLEHGSVDNWLILICRFAEFLIGSFIKGKTGNSVESSKVDWGVFDISFASLTLTRFCDILFANVTFIGIVTVDAVFCDDSCCCGNVGMRQDLSIASGL